VRDGMPLPQHRRRPPSYHDPLPGLYNRRRVEEILEEEILRAQRFSLPLCAALLDIDHFKRINDAFGHAVGDDVLRVLGRELADRVRRTDHVGRWGGEEFLLLLPGTALAGALQLIEELRRHIGRRREGLPGFTASAGVAELREGEAAPELIARADGKLYEAKKGGRDRVAA
jgi:diguanylate cyclase (GGDEF)-like protein